MDVLGILGSLSLGDLTENNCKAAAERRRRGSEDLVSNGIVEWH